MINVNKLTVVVAFAALLFAAQGASAQDTKIGVINALQA